MWLIFIFSLIFVSISASKVPICKGISYVGTYYTDKKFREPVYRYSYNLNITKNENNLTFPNTLTSYNFKAELINSSLFQRRSLFNLYFSEIDGPMKECNFLIDETCILSGPNAQISMYFEFYFKNRFYSALEPGLFVNDGIIFDNKMGKLLGPYRCEMYTMDSDFYLETSVCCPFYEYVDISDTVEDKCQTFETKAEIKDFTQNNTIVINVKYDITGNYFNSILKIEPMPNFTFSYYMGSGPTYQETDQITIPEDRFARYEIDGDFQYELLFNYHGFAVNKKYHRESEFRHIIVGELIRHNGIFYRNNNIPYTKANPCWKKKSDIYEKNATYEASFCCIKFEDTATTSLTTQKTTRILDATTSSSTTKKSTTKKLTFVPSASTPIVDDISSDINVQHQPAPCKAWHENIFDFLRDESFWFFKTFIG